MAETVAETATFFRVRVSIDDVLRVTQPNGVANERELTILELTVVDTGLTDAVERVREMLGDSHRIVAP